MTSQTAPLPASAADGGGRRWRDPEVADDERVEALLAEMTLDEKIGQLASVWLGFDQPEEMVAPGQDVFTSTAPYEEVTAHGLGHFTRVFGTAPIEPAEGARRLADLQRELVARTRLGVPAIAHEECLTGFTTYRASVFPTSLAWAASFDTETVEAMAGAIGSGMRALGVHQGLSPVLDVVRDYRWGRVEETLGEDPYLVGMLGAAYVRGLESSGVVATLKHFAGYSASRAARNHAPVPMGPREMADVILPPFEMALREGGARSVMHSYADVDGVPPAADAHLLTDVLRDEWSFEGVVVSDYWGIAFLETMHRVAGTAGEAGAVALRAGVDVELPTTRSYAEPLAELVRRGRVPESLVDRAARRVLRQKAQLGLLDAAWSPQPPGGDAVGTGDVDLDPPANRAIARQLAERSIVLLTNPQGLLPLGPATGTLAVVGPCAEDPLTFLGCYSFPNHVLAHHPDVDAGVALPSLVDALRADLPGAAIVHERGCPVQGSDRSGIPAAVEAARAADVCVAVVGDQAGLFGRGTSGEGCDAEDLRLPGLQGELVDRLLETGTPVVLLVISGRPYAIASYAERAAAVIQAFFPGEEGGPALAGVLSGRAVPSGKLPVQIPRSSSAQPGTYLHPPLGGGGATMSNLDPSPAFAFGHGLSFTTFAYEDLRLSASQVPTDGTFDVSCVVRNTGEVAGAEVVQLYLEDPVASVTRPVLQLIGFARVTLEPGDQRRVTFRVHTDRTSFTGVDLRRVVEPGLLHLRVGGSSADLPLGGTVTLVGEPRHVGSGRVLTTPVAVAPAG